MKKRLLSLALLISIAAPVLAWNHTGHKVVAQLAWRALSSAKRDAISNLLKQHPHYALLLATNVPPGVDTNEWVFMNAAVWPDMVRPARGPDFVKPSEITKYHRSQWHYINIPYVWPSDAGKISATRFSTPSTNILSALTNNFGVLKDANAAPADKAVSLCWIFHLIGDLHQPLHAATLLSQTYTNGDMGGNALAIADANEIPLNLHSFWDQILGDGDTYLDIEILSDNIANAPQYDPANLREYKDHKTFRSWCDESFTAAETFAYAEGHLKFADWKAYGAGEIKAADVPRLKSSYVINATEVSRRRISLAGRRLADELKRLF